MKILFIGNIYTYYNDLPAILKALAEENGKAVEVFSVTKGGRKLFQYLDEQDEYSEKLESLLWEHEFDVTFLQEQSVLPILDPDAFLDGVRRIREKLADRTKRVILYETWGRKEGSQMLTDHGWNREGMTRDLSASYARVAEAIGAEVSHVGLAFYALNEANPEINLHNADLTHPSREGSCLAAIVHYKTVFGELPEKIDSQELPAETVAAFLKAAT